MTAKKDRSNGLKSDYRRVWLIGASSGIGAALVPLLASRSDSLFISARNEKALYELQASALGYVHVLPLDITKSNEVENACKHISEHSGALDLVIINAGTCEYMDSHRLDLELVGRVFATNFFGAISVADKALPLLRNAKASARKRPKLVFVSSSVSYQALPRAHAYGASKAALRYFAECLRIDLQTEGLDLQVVSPGFVETPLTDVNDFPMPFRLSATNAAQRMIDGIEGKRFDISFPKRFTWVLKSFACLPANLKFRLLRPLSRHSESS